MVWFQFYIALVTCLSLRCATVDLCLHFRATALVDLEPRLLHREADDEQIPTPHLEDTRTPRKFSCSTSADGR